MIRRSPPCPFAESGGEKVVRSFVGHKIRDAQDVWPIVSFLAPRKQEHLVSISLNGAHQVIATRVVSVGTANASLVHPREVFADSITDRATAVILVHNQPSGSVEPSDEDLAVTKRLQEAGKILGIQVLDHLIVAAPDRIRSLVRH